MQTFLIIWYIPLHQTRCTRYISQLSKSSHVAGRWWELWVLHVHLLGQEAVLGTQPFSLFTYQTQQRDKLTGSSIWVGKKGEARTTRRIHLDSVLPQFLHASLPHRKALICKLSINRWIFNRWYVSVWLKQKGGLTQKWDKANIFSFSTEYTCIPMYMYHNLCRVKSLSVQVMTCQMSHFTYCSILHV